MHGIAGYTMKEIRITFDDGEFKEVMKAKRFLKASWHDFVIAMSKKVNYDKTIIWDGERA